MQTASRRVRVLALVAVIGLGLAGCGASGSVDRAQPGLDTTTTPTVPDTDVPDTDVPDTDVPDTDVPDTDVPDTEPSGVEFTTDALVSMIGRPITDEEVSALSESCYRSFEFGQDVHCEGELGFGLSFDGDSVREVYLYDYYPDGDQVSFAGALPGGVTWDGTRADIEGALGSPDCIDTIIGYNLHYTSGDLDLEFTVDASGYPTAELQKITIRPLADRGASC